MPQKPQRPFVPHRTPKTARPIVTRSEFRLYRPFLPGSHETVEAVAPIASEVIELQSSSIGALRPIEDFLAASPPPVVAVYAREKSEVAYAAESDDGPFELPPVEHFLDPLPVVEQFAPDSEGALSDAWPASNDPVAAAAGAPTGDQRESGWAETDWQSYDWRAAAALGGPDAEARNAWASTDWDGNAPMRDPRPTAAQAIASALDQIAQQIREGELAVPGSAAASDPAKIAAMLAALLGVKR